MCMLYEHPKLLVHAKKWHSLCHHTWILYLPCIGLGASSYFCRGYVLYVMKGQRKWLIPVLGQNMFVNPLFCMNLRRKLLDCLYTELCWLVLTLHREPCGILILHLLCYGLGSGFTFFVMEVCWCRKGIIWINCLFVCGGWPLLVLVSIVSDYFLHNFIASEGDHSFFTSLSFSTEFPFLTVT